MAKKYPFTKTKFHLRAASGPDNFRPGGFHEIKNLIRYEISLDQKLYQIRNFMRSDSSGLESKFDSIQRAMRF